MAGVDGGASQIARATYTKDLLYQGLAAEQLGLGCQSCISSHCNLQ